MPKKEAKFEANTDSSKQVKFLMKKAEFEDFITFIKTKTNYTLSNFIRESMNYYRRYLENPSLQSANTQISPEAIELLKGVQDDIKSLKTTMTNQTVFMDSIKKDQELQQTKIDLSKEIELIRTYISQNPSYQVAKTPIPIATIIKETNLNQDIVFKIVNLSEFFELKGKGVILK